MSIILKEKQVEKLYEGKKVKGYEGYYIEFDETTGEFDSEKGAMYDFEIYLYDAEEELVGVAYGGYYTGVGGVNFDEELEFEEPAPETDLTKFNSYLIAIANSANVAGNELSTINSKLKDITEYVKKLAKAE